MFLQAVSDFFLTELFLAVLFLLAQVSVKSLSEIHIGFYTYEL